MTIIPLKNLEMEIFWKFSPLISKKNFKHIGGGILILIALILLIKKE